MVDEELPFDQVGRERLQIDCGEIQLRKTEGLGGKMAQVASRKTLALNELFDKTEMALCSLALNVPRVRFKKLALQDQRAGQGTEIDRRCYSSHGCAFPSS